jgi:hypothetical protein
MTGKEETKLLLFFRNLIEDCAVYDYPYKLLDYDQLMDKIDGRLEELKNQD